jgi:hypothetical protein
LFPEILTLSPYEKSFLLVSVRYIGFFTDTIPGNQEERGLLLLQKEMCDESEIAFNNERSSDRRPYAFI